MGDYCSVKVYSEPSKKRYLFLTGAADQEDLMNLVTRVRGEYPEYPDLTFIVKRLCQTCNGEGEVRMNGHRKSLYPQKKTCPVCKGTGGNELLI